MPCMKIKGGYGPPPLTLATDAHDRGYQGHHKIAILRKCYCIKNLLNCSTSIRRHAM